MRERSERVEGVGCGELRVRAFGGVKSKLQTPELRELRHFTHFVDMASVSIRRY